MGFTRVFDDLHQCLFAECECRESELFSQSRYTTTGCMVSVGEELPVSSLYTSELCAV